MKPNKKTLMELLDFWDTEVDKHLKKNGRNFVIQIELTPNFLQEVRKRIVESHSKYGTDWRHKDCLKERRLEDFDNFAYTILNKCQQSYRREKQRKKKK